MNVEIYAVHTSRVRLTFVPLPLLDGVVMES